MRRVLGLICLVLAASCGPAIDEEQLDAVLAAEGDPVAGEMFYDAKCGRCHGPDGRGGGIGPKLEGNDLTDEKIGRNLLRGPLSMPEFDAEADQDLADVIAYVSGL